MIRHTTSGFVALMSVIIISAILLALVFTLGVSSFFNRFDALDVENKRASLGLAEACVSAAMLRVAQNGSYVPAVAGDCVTIGGTCYAADPQKTCAICSVAGGNPATVVTRAVYNGAFSTVQVTFDTVPDSFAVLKWEELSAGPTACIVP